MTTAEDRFRARLSELGAELLEERWLGSRAKHHVRCVNGHDTWPTPTNVAKPGRGVCGTCIGRGTAETRFLARLSELGATSLQPWSGGNKPHKVRCASGHESAPWPTAVLRGQGVCVTCTGRDPKSAESRFRVALAEAGAELLEERWLGGNTPHRVRCKEGHLCTPRPSGLSQKVGLCRACAGQDPAHAEAKFRARVEELGGTVVGEYLGAHVPVDITCRYGHQGHTAPAHVNSGRGICRKCVNRIWDAFYVLYNPITDVVKFGVTSGDPAPRLKNHRRDGFTEEMRVFVGLADDAALDLEKELKLQMRCAGVRPVRGTEYFPGAALNVLLSFVDNWGLRID